MMGSAMRVAVSRTGGLLERRCRLPRRRPVLAMVTLLGLLATTACSDDSSDSADDRDIVATSALDLDTMTATIAAGDGEVAVTAEPVGDDPAVGRVDDDLFVGVARPFGGGDDDLVVYLCDGDETSVWLEGEVGPEGDRLTHGDVAVDVAFAEGGVTGEVTMPDGAEHTFLALPAETGGVFIAAADQDDEAGDHLTGVWIVLDDGEQRGLAWWAAWSWSRRSSGGGGGGGMEEEMLQM